MTSSFTEVLGEWALATRYEDLPEAAVLAVKRSILDSLGAIAGGVRHPAIEILLRTICDIEGAAGPHTVIGHEKTIDLVNATAVNGAMAHVLDFDDTILPSRSHISAPLLPALLAVSERLERSGTEVSARDFITAFAIGFEVVTRAVDSIYDGNRGWHGTGILGAVGVSAALGRLIGLSTKDLTSAFALAANQASGLRSSYGSMAKAWNLGRAGANGVRAAFLASEGFTGGRDILDPQRGFLELFAEVPDYHVLTRDLGERWAIERNGFKPYPCGVVAHAAIDAVLEARGRPDAEAEDVTQITLTVSPLAIKLTGGRQPQTGLEGKFSLSHAAAAAYVDGEVTPKTFTDAAVRDIRYRTVAERVTTQIDPSYRQSEASIEIVCRGEAISHHVQHARGTEANPLSDEDLQKKFDSMATPVFGTRTSQISSTVWELEQRDVSSLLGSLRPQ